MGCRLRMLHKCINARVTCTSGSRLTHINTSSAPDWSMIIYQISVIKFTCSLVTICAEGEKENSSLTLCVAAYFHQPPAQTILALWCYLSVFLPHTVKKKMHIAQNDLFLFLLSLWKWAFAELLANLFSVYINIYVCAVNNICCSQPKKKKKIHSALQIQFW